ncbi:MAG: cytochrome P450 [Acidobacteria bacterium]|nr:cytochrome P450 [Acidobacteriota bacterium]
MTLPANPARSRLVTSAAYTVEPHFSPYITPRPRRCWSSFENCPIRRTLHEYEVSSRRLPPNTLILMSPFIMHRDARYCPDPLRFDPERWTPEAKAARLRFAYFPFGGASRQCIGEAFAWMEGIFLVATLVQRWRLRLLPGHPVAPCPLVTLRPKFGMKMTLERHMTDA